MQNNNESSGLPPLYFFMELLHPRMIFSTSLFYILLNLVLILLGLSEPCPMFQWLMLELSVMSLIPILVKKGLLSGVQTGLKYFLSQSPASLLILFGLCTLNISLLSLALTPALIFKLGMPPFHGWVLSLSGSVGLGELGVILSIQKILPLFMLTSFVNYFLFSVCLMWSVVIIALSANKISQLKYLLIFSSIGGGVWPVLTQMGGSWLEFMVVYTSLFLFMVFLLHLNSAALLKDMINTSFSLKLMFLITLFSMGGVPPFSGFFIKLFLLKQLLMFSSYLAVLLLMLSFAVLYLYLILVSVVGVNSVGGAFNKKHLLKLMVVCSVINSPLFVMAFSL